MIKFFVRKRCYCLWCLTSSFFLNQKSGRFEQLHLLVINWSLSQSFLRCSTLLLAYVLYNNLQIKIIGRLLSFWSSLWAVVKHDIIQDFLLVYLNNISLLSMLGKSSDPFVLHFLYSSVQFGGLLFVRDRCRRLRCNIGQQIFILVIFLRVI